MGLETATFIGGLNAANPVGTDPKSLGDDHLRLLKSTLLNSFPGYAGAVLLTGTEAQGATADDYTVTITPAPAAYVVGNAVVFSATHANTGTATTLQINSLGAKSLVDASGLALSAGDIPNGATCAAVYDGTKFKMLTKQTTAPTPALGDDSTKIATTAFANRLAFQAALPSQTGNAGKYVTTDGNAASWVALPPELPTQTGNVGKALITNGSTPSWEPFRVPSFTYYTASGTYTVPPTVTSIRAYVVGKGSAGSGATGGGGGGMAYGDIAVTPGSAVTINITAGYAKLTYEGTILLEGNPGSAPTAGTASKHASVTNGGACSGGDGNAGTTTYPGGGGAAGSPLGTGFGGGGGADSVYGGGGGIGGRGVGGGGGAGGEGGSGGYPGGGGAGGPVLGVRGGPGRIPPATFTDPLLKHAIAPGGDGLIVFSSDSVGLNAGPGGGGAGGTNGCMYGGNGGDFGGGAGAQGTSQAYGGKGGILGGGGGAKSSGGAAYGGAGGPGGGGGGASGSTTTTPGAGGAAIVIIYA